jgi:hypothetical protein
MCDECESGGDSAFQGDYIKILSSAERVYPEGPQLAEKTICTATRWTTRSFPTRRCGLLCEISRKRCCNNRRHTSPAISYVSRVGPSVASDSSAPIEGRLCAIPENRSDYAISLSCDVIVRQIAKQHQQLTTGGREISGSKRTRRANLEPRKQSRQ